MLRAGSFFERMKTVQRKRSLKKSVAIRGFYTPKKPNWLLVVRKEVLIMKKQTRWMITMALAAVAITGGVNSSSYAADEMPVYTLNPITVTATRTEKQDIDVPANVEVITAKKIEEAGYKNAFDAIQSQVGVESTGYGDAGLDFGLSSGRTVVRGYDRGTLVMVNGIPMNLKTYNSLAGIPKDMIEKIEVVKGSSGTLYGTEAMGGVVNIITKTPTDSKETFTVKGTVGNFYSDYGVTYSGPNMIVSLQKEYTDRYDHSNAFGTPFSSIDWWIGKGQANRAAIAAKLTDEVGFNFMYNDGNITRGSWNPKVSVTGGKVPYNYKFNDKRINTGLTYTGKNNGIKATIGYNYRLIDGYDYAKNQPTDSNADLSGYIADVQKKWEFGENSLIAGYSFKRENYKNRVIDDKRLHRTSDAIYLSYENVFSDKFSTILGVRAERVNDPAKDYNVFNPQIQTLYKFNNSTSWFINIGRGFQMPMVDQYYRLGEDRSKLKPEKGWTYETGIKKLISDSQSLKFSVYHMDFKDKLDWKQDKSTQEFYLSNVQNFKNSGVEIEYTQTVNDHWDYSLGLGLSDPQTKDSGKGWQQSSAKIDGVASVTYRNAKVRSTLNWKYLGDREHYISSAGTDYGQVPYLSRVSLNTIYDVTPNDSISLTMNNLFGHVNYANKYGNYELPYNWRLSYSHKF